MTRRPSLFFATDSTRLFLPWMSMLMSFIAVLVLAGGMITYTSLTRWQSAVLGSLTVQIPTHDAQGSPRGEAVAADVEKALTLLRASPGITGATVLSDAQMSELMLPWLGAEAVVDELPLPKLIDVGTTTDTLSVAQLRADLAEQVPTAVLENHRSLLAPLIQVARGVIKLIGFILLLLVLTVSFTVIYATQSSLSVHHPVIALVHMMGAADFYITRQYAFYNLRATFLGSLFGLVLALPLMAGAAALIRGATAEFSCALAPAQWGVLLAVPPAIALLAFFTTFKTVLSYLKRFL